MGNFPRGAFGLDGKIAAVTGAGSGIGRAVAESLAAEGAVVALLDRDANLARETESRIRAAGGDARAFVCDVSDPEQVRMTAAAVNETLGFTSILVNNAGMILPGAMAGLRLEDWNSVLAVNLTGCFLCAQAFGAEMRRQKRGAIINMASIASTYPTPYSGAYSVTKAGVAMLSRQLAVEWGPDGVRSNAVCPGMILTELSRSMYARPGVAEARSATIPARRIGQPEDVAEAVLFLASDRSAYLNGAEIAVDGGFPRNLLGLVPRAGFEAPQGNPA